MKKVTPRLPGRVLLGALIIGMGLLVAPVTSRGVGATLSTCGGCALYGPIIHLSNGDMINTGVRIRDAAADVSRIDYVLHAPRGTVVSSVSFQGSKKVNQTFQFSDDMSSHAYTVDTYVSTYGGPLVQVFPFTAVKFRGSGDWDYADGLGLSKQHILVTVSAND